MDIPLKPQDSDGLSDLSLRRTEALSRLVKPTAMTIGTVQTAVPGTDWATLPNITCDEAVLVNNTGTDIEVRRGAGETFDLLDGCGYPFRGLLNASNLSVRRIDQSDTPVTLKVEAIVY